NIGQNLGFGLFLAGSGVTFTLLRFPNGIAGAAQSLWQRYLDRRGVDDERTLTATDADLPLVVDGVRVHFGGVVALNQPDIVVRSGEIVGLIGTNGAGKTTLMN